MIVKRNVQTGFDYILIKLQREKLFGSFHFFLSFLFYSQSTLCKNQELSEMYLFKVTYHVQEIELSIRCTCLICSFYYQI